MEVDFPDLDLDKAEKAAKAIGYFWLIGTGGLAFLIAWFKAYKSKRPRMQIAELKSDIDALKKLVGELTKSVGANNTNIIGNAEQLASIAGDAERRVQILRSDQESKFVRIGVHDDLCERVQQLDERVWQLGGGAPRRRQPARTREVREHDPRD